MLKMGKAKCKGCGTKEDLTKHHIIPKRTGKKSGTITLCRGCHNIADRNHHRHATTSTSNHAS